MLHTVIIGYAIVNSVFSFVIINKSRHSLLSRFYCFCVFCLVLFVVISLLLGLEPAPKEAGILSSAELFLFSEIGRAHV